MSQRKPTQSEIDAYAANFVLYGAKSKAWRVAFPSSKAKNETINIRALEFHQLSKVCVRVDELTKQAKVIAEKEFELDAKYVAKRLKEIDELDMLDIMQDDLKSFKQLSEWPKAWRTSISGLDLITLSKQGDNIEAILKKVKWPDKTKNLELIGKLTQVSAFSDNINITRGENITPWGEIKASIDKKD